MTLKYESEILLDLMKRDGDDAPSVVLPYESELKEKYLKQVEGAYPKLMDYRSEWLNYNLNVQLPAEFPMETLSNVTNATVDNVVPYEYGSAILKGNTKYRDIDTGDILDTFDETKNLELVSVKMPVLTTTGKNLFSLQEDELVGYQYDTTTNSFTCFPDSRKWTDIPYVKLIGNQKYTISYDVIKPSSYSRIEFNITNGSIPLKYPSKIGAQSTTFNIVKDAELRIKFLDGDAVVRNIQIEVGSTATTYEPYKSNILTVNEKVELRGIGDVKDELNLLTGEVTQRIGETTLDGSEKWSGSGGNYRVTVPNVKPYKDLTWGQKSVMCNLYPSFNGKETDAYIISEWDSNQIRIHDINTTLEELKTKLRENPLRVIFILTKDSDKTVELNCINEQGESVTFRPIEGTMHVSTSSQTLPTLLDMSVPVEATSQNLMSFANIVEEE